MSSNLKQDDKQKQITAFTELAKMYALLGNSEKAQQCLVKSLELRGANA